MIEAGVARYPIPVFQYVARDRYAYLGEYLVSEYPTADVQLRTGTRINALRFRLTPASSWTKERYVSDREVEALAIDAGLDLVFSREGRTALREHLARERSPGNRLVVIRRKGLRCEACTFHFGERFGPQLEGFIEVHHVRPLASGEYEPTLDDFVVLCANCHRAAHHRRGLEPRTVNELKALLSLQAVRLSPAPALSSLTRSI
jgi:5-methylcytosine-specific restriction endonuclease McrA